MKITGYDFSGWASMNDLECMDGITIRKDAFADQDGQTVPLVYNHDHSNIRSIIGHAVLENRDEGVYVYGFLNETESGKHAKETLKHGDVESLSIWANNLYKKGSDVLHGIIREVSLVLAGANPGAFVESVVAHSCPMGDDEDECILFTGEGIIIAHSMDDLPKKEKGSKEVEDEEKTRSPKEILDGMSDEQKEAVAFIVSKIMQDLAGKEIDEEKEDDEVIHSIFDQDKKDKDREEVTYLSHSDMKTIFQNAKKCGSLREAVHDWEEEHGGVIAHSIDTTGMTVPTGTQAYGVNDVSMLLPEYKTLNTPPEFISRNMTWVSKVIADVHKTPFSRIRSLYANITEDEARARGYIKGKQKKEEVFTTLKRTTDPQTVYKKQKLDRDDILDIRDFDVVNWIRGEMRIMLNEEIARAILIGDGRPSDSEDKIQELHIRPVATDVPLFNVIVKVTVPADADGAVIAKETINAIIRARKQYKGSGNPSFWTTEDVLTEMLLLEDGIGHKLYKTENEVSTTLRVREVVPVEPMEGYKITVNSKEYPLIGTIVNLNDYNVGADRGADAVDMFEDFDIDYNQYKYLIEKRMSGALVKPFSALTFVLDKTGSGE